VYNALNSIQDLVLQNDIRSANIYFSKFSTLMRKVLDASGKDKLPLQEELDMLELYLELEKLRFGKQFEYALTVVGVADKEELAIPAMIIQPFVENALKHGLLHKDGEKKLSIQFELQHSQKQLVCTITDNGVGRKRSDEINARKVKNHKSFAVNATQKRLELLNKYYQGKIGLQTIDLGTDEQPTGTMVVLHLPVEYI
jgi:sensor histidine kinase YesM